MRRRDFVSLLGAAAAARGAAGDARAVISSEDGDRMRVTEGIRFGAVPAGVPVIEIDAGKRYQRIDGFGATFTEAGIMTLNKLAAPKQEQVLRSLFDTREGAGFSVMKSPLAAFDFSAAGPWFSYDDHAGDTELKHFSVDRDFAPTGIATFVKRAQKHGKFGIQSTMDFPPDWMLDAKLALKPEYYDACARYQVKYLKAYRDRGIPVDWLAPFNEPEYIYCKTTFEDTGTYIREHLGPRLRESGLQTKLQFCESMNRGTGLKEYPGVLKDERTRAFLGGMSLHGYSWDDQGSSALGKLHEMFPDVPLWQSEVCYAWVIDKKPMPVHGFEDGDRWGRMIVSDLHNHASAWIYWNMILDEKGGPWLVSEVHGNPARNEQHPVLILDTQKGEPAYTGVYWYLAHFSKFVRPGAVRVRSEGESPKTMHTAFVTPAGGRVLEIVHSGSEATEIAVREGANAAVVKVPARSIATVLWERA